MLFFFANSVIARLNPPTTTLKVVLLENSFGGLSIGFWKIFEKIIETLLTII